MANIQWYYSRGNGDMQGPVSPAELARLAQVGELRPGDLVWKEGMEEWIAADRIKGLDFGASSAVQPTPAPPVQVSSTPPVQNVAPPVQYTAPPVKTAARSAQPKTRDIAGPLWFLDLDFNHLISTSIVRGIWALYLILSALWVVYLMIGLIRQSPTTYALGYCAALGFLYVITTLLVRLMLEGAMVLFRISEDLRAIRDIAAVSQSERGGASLSNNGTY